MPRPQHMFLPYIKPVMPRLLHHSSPTSSLLCSGSYIMPAMARSQYAPTDIMPFMPRPLHYNPSPTSSLLCPGSYRILLYPDPNICSTLNQPAMPRPLHDHPSPTSSLSCAQDPTSNLPCSGSNIRSILQEACCTQAPTYIKPAPT